MKQQLQIQKKVESKENIFVIIPQQNKYFRSRQRRVSRVRQNNASGNITEQYTYDQDGNRLKKIEYRGGNISNNETTYYFNSRPVDFIQVRNASGIFNFSYYYMNGKLVASKMQGKQMLYYHDDHLGSTTLVTNQSGSVVDNILYLPYGEIYQGNENTSRFLFTKKELDKGTDFYYFGARYYDPKFSHFIQPDKIKNVYDPQNLNSYVYTLNNPYKYFDPNGNEPIKSELIGANQIVSQIQQIESAHPDWNARQTLIAYASRYNSPSNQIKGGGSKGFIYTSEKGFIDTQHFFTNAKVGAIATVGGSNAIGLLVAEANAVGVGTGIEVAQKYGYFGGKESSFSYEDLPSNVEGALVGASISSQGRASEQIASYFNSIGASNDPLIDIHSSILDTIPPTRESATSGKLLPDYKRNFNPFSKAVPKDQNRKSFFSRFFRGGK